MTEQSPARDVSSRSKAPATALVLLAFLGILAYANTMNAAFLPDDQKAILENPSIRSLWPPGVPLSPPLGSSVSGRPLGNLSFALNWALGRDWLPGYHAVNLALHILCAFALFGIARRSLRLPRFSDEIKQRSEILAFFIAALWLCHPIATQAVTHITQRLEVLMGLFFLCCLYCAIRGFGSSRPLFWHILSPLCFIAGIFVKEVIVAAPFCVLAYDLTFHERGPIRALRRSPLLYAGLGLGLVVLIWHVSLGEQGTAADAPISPLTYLFTQSRVIFFYLGQILWPNHLSYDHRAPLALLSQAWPFFAALCAAGMACVYLLFRRSPSGFLLAWFFLTLAPTSSLKPLRQIMVDYRPYLALASVCAFFVVGGFGLAAEAAKGRSEGARKAAVGLFFGLCLALVLALGLATRARNEVYRDPVSLWRDATQKSPGSFVAFHNLGNALLTRGRPAEAAESFAEALRQHPDYFEAHLSYGVALVRLGRPDEAELHMERALAIKPDYPEAHLSLSTVLMARGQSEEAEKHLEAALALKPDYVNALNNLGLLYSQTGRPELAEPLHRKAISLAPARPDSYADLGVSLARQGKSQEAVKVLTYALSQNPNDPVAAAYLRALSRGGAGPIANGPP